jgi:hypothetical protein
MVFQGQPCGPRSIVWFKVNHGIKFKETHALQSFLDDVNIAAGRHLERDKPNPFYWRALMLRVRKRHRKIKTPVFPLDISVARVPVSPSLLHTLILCVVGIVSRM